MLPTRLHVAFATRCTRRISVLSTDPAVTLGLLGASLLLRGSKQPIPLESVSQDLPAEAPPDGATPQEWVNLAARATFAAATAILHEEPAKALRGTTIVLNATEAIATQIEAAGLETAMNLDLDFFEQLRTIEGICDHTPGDLWPTEPPQWFKEADSRAHRP